MHIRHLYDLDGRSPEAETGGNFQKSAHCAQRAAKGWITLNGGLAIVQMRTDKLLSRAPKAWHQPGMTRFNGEQLRTFLAVVRLGGVRRAASALNLTQPAVTARIKALETALACTLFDRTASGMRLTKRGELLVGHAEKFEHLGEVIQRDVIDPEGVEGRLRLGVSETVAECWLPEFVTALRRAFPNLDVELNVDVSMHLRSALLDREIDLAVLLGPISDYSVDNIELPVFELGWYRAASETRADMADLLSRPVMTYARNTRPYRELKEMLLDRVGPDISLIPSSSLSASFRLVEANIGVGALPRILGDAHAKAGRIAQFDPGWSPSPLQFTASYLSEPRSHVTETAANLAREVAVDHFEAAR